MLQPWTGGAVPDWEARVVAGESLIPWAPLFPGEAEAALAVFRELKIVDAAGSPTIGAAARPWFIEFARAVFGAYDPDTGRRLIRYFFLLISKKNGKSTLAAAIMLTVLIRNWRMSAEFVILAPTIEIAGNSFAPARDMIRADSELGEILHVQEHLRTITHRGTQATLKIVAADAETVSGKKAVGVLVDELWLLGKRPNAENMLREATGGLASRPEGFVIYLSTQSDEPPTGVFKQRLAEFRGIRDGTIRDGKSLGVFYEFPQRLIESRAYLDPKHFYVTNPNLGVSVDEEFLLDELRAADRSGAASVNGFAAKHLNVEIGQTQRTDRWPGAEYWQRRGDRKLTKEAVLDGSEAIVVGIDGGGLDDLFGLAVLGRDPTPIEVTTLVDGVPKRIQIKPWLLWSHAWCHKGVLDRRKSIATRLEEFAAAGELTIVDDQLDDISAIVAIVEDIKARGLLAEVAVDPAGLGEFVDAMDSIDVTVDNGLLVGVGQGYRMMNALKTAERRLANGTLRHGASALMAWCVGNLKIEPTATAIRATKQNAGDAKIDPAMALFNAVDRMSLNPETARSVYEERDLLVI